MRINELEYLEEACDRLADMVKADFRISGGINHLVNKIEEYIEEKDNEIEKFKENIKDLEKQIEKLEGLLKDKDEEIKELKEDLQYREDEADRLQYELDFERDCRAEDQEDDT